MAVSAEIAADFLVEAREILDRLGEQLVTLEHDPSDMAQMNAVFRGFHTLKGGAGFLGINAMVQLCHAAEGVLGTARSRKTTLEPQHFDAAQQALDYLQRMLDAVGAGNDAPFAPASLIGQFDIDLGRVATVDAGALVAAPIGSVAPTDAGAIDDDEFEALLDQLQAVQKPLEASPGAGAASGPGSPVPPPAAPTTVRTSSAPPAPRPPPAAAPPPTEPEPTIRVDTKRLDAIVNLVGELVLSRNRLKTVRARIRDEELDRAVSGLDTATARLQSAVMRTRMQPVGKVFSRFPKVARDVARSLHKEVDLKLLGADTELDRNLVEALADPLVHLVRNAIDHGIEVPAAREAAGKTRMGQVCLSAQQEGDYVTIEIRDDGAGMDPERLRSKALDKRLMDMESAARLSHDECLQLVFLAGFSTKGEVSDVSGRGMGMDVVQSRIRELSGQIQIHSELGRGSRFVIRVPLTLAILPALLVEASEQVYALPLARVMEILHTPSDSLRWFDGKRVLDRKNDTMALVDLRLWLDVDAPFSPFLTVVVLQICDQRFGLVVDKVRGREEVVIKPLPRLVRGLPGYSGATLVGDGRMALILNVDGLRESAP